MSNGPECPNCGHVDDDITQQCTSLHGNSDTDLYDVTCPECNVDFQVLEIVERSWEVVQEKNEHYTSNIDPEYYM